MAQCLTDADGERIESDHTPRSISAELAAKMGYHPEIGACASGRLTHHAHYGGEADGLASTALTAFVGNQWAEVVNAADYDVSGISRAALNTLGHIAADTASEHEDDARQLGRLLAVVGERFARHSAEHALQEHFSDTELAGIEREHENVDVTCDAGDAQVYTGSSAKYWYNKSHAPACANGSPDDYEKAVEQTNFDVFVFIRIIDGAFHVGAKTIENENETAANTKAKK